MAPVQLVDIVGSTLMIIFALLCVRHANRLRLNDPQNVIWTYLLWFSAGLFIFSVSRSVGHLVKHVLMAAGHPNIWYLLRPVTGSLNSISFVILGSITLFFHRVYSTYRQMQEDRVIIERAHADIMKLNVNLEEMVRERTRELSASEEKYRIIFEGSKDMIFICDENGNFTDINRSGVELFGFRENKEIIGRNLFEEFLVQPAGKRIKNDIKTGDFVKDVEVKLRKRNGEEVIALFSATSRRIDGGRHISFEGTVKDITMRKAMESQLLQADKLASLGQLSAGVAHEINNPLGLILGYTQLLLRDVKQEEQLWDDLKTIEKHTMNCKRIVEDLLKFSRSTDTKKTSTNLNELVNEVLAVVEANFELDNVRILRKLSQGIPRVTVDPDKMKQVFMNLLMNARQAIDEAGSIVVSTSSENEGQEVLISFADDGCGIQPSLIDKIFDPFFTNKSTGMGTGLGLSVSYGIIKDHEGEISVESKPQHGAVFNIRLPIQAAGSDEGRSHIFKELNHER